MRHRLFRLLLKVFEGRYSQDYEFAKVVEAKLGIKAIGV